MAASALPTLLLLNLAALLLDDRRYPALDDTDKVSCRPDFSPHNYTGGFVARDDVLDKGEAVPETVAASRHSIP